MPPLEIRLDRSPHAPSAARHALADWLRRVPCRQDTVDEVILVASELVTNAVVHARSAPLITAVFDDGWLRLEVHDDSAVPPTMRPAPPRTASVSTSCRNWLTAGVGHRPTRANTSGSRCSVDGLTLFAEQSVDTRGLEQPGHHR